MTNFLKSQTLKLVMTFILFGIFFANLDFDRLQEQVAKLQVSTILIASIAILFQSLIGAARWHLLLTKVTVYVERIRTLNVYLSAVFINQILPASIGGDAVRAVMIRRGALTLDAAIVSIFVERALMLLCLISVMFIQQLFFVEEYFFSPGTVISLVGSFLTLIFFLWVSTIFLWRRLKWKWTEKINGWYASLLSLVKQACLDWRTVSVSIFLAYGGVIAFCTAIYLISMGLGISISFQTSCLIGPTILLASTLPISLGGWGVREGATATCFVLVGLDLTDGLMVGVCLSVVTLIAALPGAFSLVLSLKLSAIQLSEINALKKRGE